MEMLKKGQVYDGVSVTSWEYYYHLAWSEAVQTEPSVDARSVMCWVRSRPILDAEYGGFVGS